MKKKERDITTSQTQPCPCTSTTPKLRSEKKKKTQRAKKSKTAINGVLCEINQELQGKLGNGASSRLLPGRQPAQRRSRFSDRH